MAAVKYRGLNPRTGPLLWAVYALAFASILYATGPTALDTATAWFSSEQERLPWYATRLLGMLAYGALAISVIYGLLLSTGALDAIAHRAVSFTLHQDLAALGLGLAMVHGALLTLDRTVPYSVGQVVVPFAGSYRPLWVGIGQVAMYLMVIVYASFWVRRRIGQRAWRLVHNLAFLAFAGATAHGLASGSDTTATWAFGCYVAAGVVVAFLSAYRATIGFTKLLGRLRPASRSQEIVRVATFDRSTAT